MGYPAECACLAQDRQIQKISPEQGCIVVEVTDRDDRLTGITGAQQDVGNDLGVTARAVESTLAWS